MAKGIFISTNMSSTQHGGARIYDAIATTEIENGTFGYLEGLKEGEECIYTFVKGTKAGAKVVVVDQPPFTYASCVQRGHRRDMISVPANTPFRVREIAMGDEFAVSKDNFASSSQSGLAVGKFVTVDATGKLVAKGTTTESAIIEGKVIRKKMQGNVLTTPARTYGYQREIYEIKVDTLA